MDTSFELLSSMSPKINKNQKPVKKAPTILALKKHVRRSLVTSNIAAPVKDVTIVSVGSSSTNLSSTSESESSKSNSSNNTPIVISDSEQSFNNEESPPKKFQLPSPHVKNSYQKTEIKRLSNEKYTNIQNWVDQVNSAKHNSSQFSTVSSICGGNDKGRNVAASSTLLHSDAKRFDELFKDKTCSNSKNNIVINDSLESDEIINDLKNMTIDDSLNLSLSARIKKKQACEQPKENNHQKTDSIGDSSDWESLLDSIYGSKWRAKKDDILPSSEPRPTKTGRKIEKKAPNTERRVNEEQNSNNLLKILQKARFKKALESPWAQSLKNVCDSDTDSEDGRKVLPAMRLNFDDEKDVKTPEPRKPKQSVKIKSKKKTQDVKVQDNGNKIFSFIASLSGDVPYEKCDISALVFRENFKQHKEALASKLFGIFNDKVFDNSLPKNTPIEWSDRLIRTAGTCTCKKITHRNGSVERIVKIVLASKVLDSANRLRDTLIHEMCHAATWIVNEISDGHGSFWKSWAHRAMTVFPELPPISRCHNYVINTKYTYKCTGCGYSIGRHTKSLDVQRKRCGHCYGTFDVLVNKTSKKGETKSVPATPKKLTGFALFVKENYANCKTPDLKHADVMKVLGQKFAKLKVDQS